MMKYVDRHRDIELAVGERQMLPIEFPDRYRRAVSHQHIDALDPQVGTKLEQLLAQQAISAANVENPR